jgi:hypothetical protein
VSLSQEPALSVLKNELVCGYRDISKESYAGFSGKHDPDGNAVATTNGAGPHNLQTFLLASDGTVLHCLPGYWNPKDLVQEIEFAARLDDLWRDNRYSVTQKKQMFSQMQLSHLDEHSFQLTQRSRMQGFDMKHEAKNRPYTSDTILNPQLAVQLASMEKGSKPPVGAKDAFKTTDRIMHERMSVRPFVPYSQFDVAAYVDYGRPKYDKNEDFRDSRTGQLADEEGAKKQEMLGQVPEKPMRRRKGMGMGNRMMQRGANILVRKGVRNVLWGQN